MPATKAPASGIAACFSPADSPRQYQVPDRQEVLHLLRNLEAAFEGLQKQNLELSTEVDYLRGNSKAGGTASTSKWSPRICLDEESGEPAMVKPAMVKPDMPPGDNLQNAGAQAAASEPVRESVIEPQDQETRLEDVRGGSRAEKDKLLRRFEKLDKEGKGKVYLKDLKAELEKQGIEVEQTGLVELHRAVQGPDHAAHSQDGLGFDFHDYVNLITQDIASLSPSAEKALRGIRSLKQERGTVYEGIGRCRRLGYRMRMYMEIIPSCVILMNMITAGLSTDLTEHQDVWDAIEYFYLAFYSLECFLKCWIYGCHGYFCGPGLLWNIFDVICVLISVFDILLVQFLFPDAKEADSSNPLMLIKILRLARLGRFVRLLRFKAFTELKLMVLGVFSGLRVLTWAIVLLLTLMYLLGIAMASIFGSIEEYRNVPSAMFTLFRCWTEGCAAYNGTPLAEHLREKWGFQYFIFHVFMMMVVGVGVFNLIMAIFIDNVVTTQMQRKHKEMEERSQEIELRFKKILLHLADGSAAAPSPEQAVSELPSYHYKKNILLESSEINKAWAGVLEKDLEVTRLEFLDWLDNDDFIQVLDDADIETTNKYDLFDVLDADMGNSLTLRELVTGLMKLRGPVTKADIVAVRLKVRNLTSRIESDIQNNNMSDWRQSSRLSKCEGEDSKRLASLAAR